MADAIHAEIDRLKKEDISDDELKMIKTRAKANLIRGLADNEGLASQLATYQARYGDWRELFRRSIASTRSAKPTSAASPTKTFVRTNRTVGIIETPAAAHGSGQQGGGAMKRTLLARGDGYLRADHSTAAIGRASGPLATDSDSAAARLSIRKQPKRIELPNGMVIFLQEDHELPLIDGVARIRGGSRHEPADKAGLVDMYGEVWRTGGTKIANRRSARRLPRSPRRQSRNRRQCRFHHDLLLLPEGRFRRRVQSVRRPAAESRIPRRQTRPGAEGR